MTNGGDRSAAVGAVHETLEGSSSQVRFRSERVPADALRARLAFRFVLDGEVIGPLPVLDLSATGLGVQAQDVFAPPGAVLEDAELLHHEDVLWRGTASAAYQVDSPTPRLGVRFTSGPIDLATLRMHDSSVQGVREAIADLQRAQAVLSPEYRTLIADLAQLLVRLRSVLEDAERELPQNDPLHRNDEELQILESVYASWAPNYHALVQALHNDSLDFSPEEQQVSQSYATALIENVVGTGEVRAAPAARCTRCFGDRGCCKIEKSP